MTDKSIGWMAIAGVATAMVFGCTNNTIGAEGGGDGSATDSGDPPPTVSADGSDGDPPLECSDWTECGDCGECIDGACVESPGCCSAVEDSPWQWRCSKPWECYEDYECGEGAVCEDGFCQDGPDAPVIQPPACGDDVVFEISSVPLPEPLVRISASSEDGVLVGVDSNRQIWQSLHLGTLEPVGEPIPGDGPVDLVDARFEGVLAIASSADDAGVPGYTVSRVNTGFIPSFTTSERVEGYAEDAAWAGNSADVVVANAPGLDLWREGQPPTLDEQLVENVDPATIRIAPLAIAGDDAGWVGLATSDGSVAIIDIDNAMLIDAGVAPSGEMIDLDAGRDPTAGGQVQLVALTSLDISEPTEQTWSAVSTITIDPELPSAPAFGAEGSPTTLLVADVDRDGNDDIIVGNADGRIDVYLRDEAGVRCRGSLPIEGLVDLVTVDSDGNGQREVMFLDGFQRLFVIEGVGG